MLRLLGKAHPTPPQHLSHDVSDFADTAVSACRGQTQQNSTAQLPPPPPPTNSLSPQDVLENGFLLPPPPGEDEDGRRLPLLHLTAGTVPSCVLLVLLKTSKKI